mmetsp:Transcript_5039/g.12325  ORF Transcript_5039/g.12325 Transcript_5039/m.12325 type:complete len:872 (-) Transcript_5039:46-2661(-)
MALFAAPPPTTDCELFEGPEKTLTLCFKSRRIASKSLRLIPQEAWENVLKHAKCEILSAVESTPPVLASKNKEKVVASKGVTAYLLSESSLFVSDTSLSLKTCGRTTPLAALEPILDLAVPTWRKKDPEHYLKYATFTRLGYMRPDEQLEPHTSWEQEVSYMDKHFKGEAVVLGSETTSAQHVYVANYLPKDEVCEMMSTQVALTNLDTSESMQRYGPPEARSPDQATPLKTAWKELHGDDRRSIAANHQLDERFFDPIGYSSNGVFGRNFTTIHITPQPGCSYLSVETTMPMTKDARRRFVAGAQGLCRSDSMAVTEFALCPKLFQGAAPEVLGFELQRSTQTVGTGFACAHHHYERRGFLPSAQESVSTPESSPAPAEVSLDPIAQQVVTSKASPAESSPAATVSTAASSPPLSTTDECIDDQAGLFQAFPAEASKSAIRSMDSTTSKKEPCDDEAQEVQEAPLVIRAPTSGVLAVTAAAEHVLANPGKLTVDEPISLLDITALRQQASLWHRLLPRVEPFYAVKCNPQPSVVKALWAMWKEIGIGGFDCASPAEIQLVMSLGVNPAEHIVFANPCKQSSAVNFARASGVSRLVFDNSAELMKLADLYPEAEMLLRVQTDDALAQCPLSNKFGAAPADCAALLAQARDLGLKVVGVSFHVGSGCSQSGAFRGALQRARFVFDEAARIGFDPEILDIGGGFPGWDEPGQATFADHAADIRELLGELFPSPRVRVIAEPGRFFVASAQAVLTTVVSVAEASRGSRYYLNDGLYGSFNCLLYDHAVVPRPMILRDGHALEESSDIGEACKCTLFGPTCDGFDVISDSLDLPQLRVGDRLLFANMGAYTTAASTSFNGFGPAACFVYESRGEE